MQPLPCTQVRRTAACKIIARHYLPCTMPVRIKAATSVAVGVLQNGVATRKSIQRNDTSIDTCFQPRKCKHSSPVNTLHDHTFIQRVASSRIIIFSQ